MKGPSMKGPRSLQATPSCIVKILLYFEFFIMLKILLYFEFFIIFNYIKE